MKITLETTTFEVTHGGVSKPLKIEFKEYIPLYPISINVSMLNNSIGISESDYIKDLTITTSSPQAVMMLKSDIKFGKIGNTMEM